MAKLIIQLAQQYWMIIPVVLYLLLVLISKFIRTTYVPALFSEQTSFLSLIWLFCSIKISYISNLFNTHFEIIAFVIMVVLFISLINSRDIKDESEIGIENHLDKQLFNLFYVNTSKAHEIAMLIDNKIMRTIEREQVSEELLKYNTSFLIGKPDNWSSEIGYLKEDNSRKKVYENFDVKTTKSIMLSKIYENIKMSESKGKQTEHRVGDLIIFNNIELKERNIDDTIMILNVLQDSKIKDESNDSLELNLNKMMDKMLDDFTIDYNFSANNKSYIIQIPYKSIENFENGYQHNDLQLGKLGLIGIYRGEINFSQRESISSKFLEIMSESYNKEKKKTDYIQGKMKLSEDNDGSDEIELNFNHKKLTDELHLIDVIAIIQELNIDRGQL